MVSVVHDGPCEAKIGLLSFLDLLDSVRYGTRFCLLETPERKLKFGHPWRSWGFEKTLGSFICTTNDDNWYAPTFVEAMVHSLQSNKADFAYCDMVHSHKQWQPMKTELKRGSIDLGCWMASRELVLANEWDDFGFAGDWSYIHKLKHAAKKIVKVPMTLFVHN